MVIVSTQLSDSMHSTNLSSQGLPLCERE